MRLAALRDPASSREENPFHLDAEKTVYFGEQTWDELINGVFIAAMVEDDTVPAAKPVAMPLSVNR